MRELILQEFRDARLASGWFTESTAYRCTPAGLDAGPSTGFVVALPGHGWTSLRVEIDLRSDQGGWVHCGWDGVLALTLTLADTPYPRHEALEYQAVYAESTTALPGPGPGRQVSFEFEAASLQARCGDQLILAAPNRRGEVFTGAVHLAFRHCLVGRVRILGDGPCAGPLYPAPPRTGTEYILQAAVDFPDDLIGAPFDAAMLDAYFAEIASWGARQVHWIFTGRQEEGLLDDFPIGVAAHAAATARNVGEIFAAASEAVHRHGMEMVAVIKPFEMGFPISYGEGTAAALSRGRLPRIGGPIGWITRFAARRRDLVMARRPAASGPPRGERFTRIDLVKEDDRPAAIGPADVEILVSDDNARYRPYAGPERRTETIEDYPVYEHTPSGPRPTGQRRRRRVLRLAGLEIQSRYIALVVRGAARSFANRLAELVHVFSEAGEEHRLTFALKVRTTDYHYQYGALEPLDRIGLEFDHFPGSPTAGCGGGYDAMNQTLALDSALCPAAVAPATGRPAVPFTVLGIARGREPTTVAALSPSFPATRQWWLRWVNDALDLGADGIDLRVGNHHAEFAWTELGFEPPVRDEFRRRYGVDLWADDGFDRAAWRRLRGEGYTAFYREASALVRRRGKRLALHVEPSIVDECPAAGGAMAIQFDWHAWLREGLADSVTLKSVWPGSRLFQEILSLTRPRRVPVIFAPYSINFFSPYGAAVRKTGGAQTVDALIRMGREAGCDGFQFYEVAAALQAKAGEVRLVEPALKEVLCRQFGAAGPGTAGPRGDHAHD